MGVEKVPSTMAKCSGVAVGVYGFTFNQWIAVAGLSIALISLVVDIAFKMKKINIMQSKEDTVK